VKLEGPHRGLLDGCRIVGGMCFEMGMIVWRSYAGGSTIQAQAHAVFAKRVGEKTRWVAV